MPIVLVRVDDRLIHGQILEGWLPSTKAEQVLSCQRCISKRSPSENDYGKRYS